MATRLFTCCFLILFFWSSCGDGSEGDGIVYDGVLTRYDLKWVRDSNGNITSDSTREQFFDTLFCSIKLTTEGPMNRVKGCTYDLTYEPEEGKVSYRLVNNWSADYNYQEDQVLLIRGDSLVISYDLIDGSESSRHLFIGHK